MRMTEPGDEPPSAAPGYVLVVEDDPMLRRVVVKTLLTWGYAIREACDGGAAITEIRHSGPTLRVVLLDIMLPVMDGVSVAREALRDQPDLPIVACSAALNRDVEANLRDAGVRHFLPKPYSADNLRHMLEVAIRN